MALGVLLGRTTWTVCYAMVCYAVAMIDKSIAKYSIVDVPRDFRTEHPARIAANPQPNAARVLLSVKPASATFERESFFY